MNQDNNRIFDKLDKIDEKMERKFDRTEKRLDQMERELIIYNEELKHHIEGTRQVVIQNEQLKDYMDLEVEKMRKEILPIREHVQKLNGFWEITKKIGASSLKILGGVSIILGIYAKLTGKF